GSLRCLGKANSLSASLFSSAVLMPSPRRGTFALRALALCTCRALAMLRRAASFCRVVATAPPLNASRRGQVHWAPTRDQRLHSVTVQSAAGHLRGSADI